MQKLELNMVMVPKSKIEEIEKRIAALEKQAQERQMNSEDVLLCVTKGLEEAVTGEKLLNGYCNSKEKPLVSVFADSGRGGGEDTAKARQLVLAQMQRLFEVSKKDCYAEELCALTKSLCDCYSSIS